MNRKIVLVFLGLVVALGSYAQKAATATPQQAAQGQTKEHIEKRYTLYFRVNRTNIDRSYMNNGRTIEAMVSDIESTLAVEGSVPGELHIHAASSPEGSRALNERLALQRAANARKLLVQLFPQYSQKDIKVESMTNDWSGVIQRLRLSNNIKYRDTLLQILANPRIQNKDAAIRAIPAAFNEIRSGLFDYMRTASITISVVRTAHNVDAYVTKQPVRKELTPLQESDAAAELLAVPAVESEPAPKLVRVEEAGPAPLPPFYMGVRSNLLYDAIAIPNIGVEFYLGNRWSVLGNWMYSWWKTDREHWYWRTYGGDLSVRRWFGRKAQEKPLTGHHVGIYGQIVTYDFETGGRGYLADRWSGGGGVEYGYAMPVGKRLNLDFNLGVGYSGGEVKEYIPIDSHYVWQKTKRSRWFGPTKVEVALTWLLGRGNINKDKGGKR